MADQADGIFSPYLRKKRFEAVKPFVGGRVLDFGCGIGRARRVLGIQEYVGVDSDPASLDIARAENPGAAFITPGELWNSAIEPFDTIMLVAVIEHLPKPGEILMKLRSFMKPGGRLVLTTPQPQLDWAHGLGSRLGLFSHEAHDEHQSLMNREGIQEAASQSGLKLATYRTFLFGANQLAVLEACRGLQAV